MDSSLIPHLPVFLVPLGLVWMAWGSLMKKTATVVAGVFVETLAVLLLIYTT